MRSTPLWPLWTLLGPLELGSPRSAYLLAGLYAAGTNPSALPNSASFDRALSLANPSQSRFRTEVQVGLLTLCPRFQRRQRSQPSSLQKSWRPKCRSDLI